MRDGVILKSVIVAGGENERSKRENCLMRYISWVFGDAEAENTADGAWLGDLGWGLTYL